MTAQRLSPTGDRQAPLWSELALHRLRLPCTRVSIRYFLAKRLIDLALALVSVVVLSPVLLLLAVAVKATSRGPALYRQSRVGARRVGYDEGDEVWELAPFTLYKFRSMRANASDSPHVQQVRLFTEGRLDRAAGAAVSKLHEDSRITPLGRILRRSSLDELPQFVNVLKGNMSLVGPRPLPVYEARLYPPEYYRRFAARPGITGLWQTCGRGDVGFEQMVALDLDLVDRRSLWLETKILLRTMPAVLHGYGAA